MITTDTILERLRSHGVIDCKHPISDDTYKIAVQYMTQKMLQTIVNDVHSLPNRHFVTPYKQAADAELTERNLLGKKRLVVPV